MEEQLKDRLTNLTEWRPTERQEDFFQIPYDVFEALYGGALGGGKTTALILVPILLRTKNSNRQLYEHPNFIGIIFRRTFPELEKLVIDRAKHYYLPLGAVYNETKKVFTFPSGAKMFLDHMEKEKDVLRHDTNEYNYVGIDQAEQFTEFQLRYITSRIRSANTDLPTICRMGANPGGESHVYLRDRFVKPAPEGNVILEDKVTKLKRIYIPAKLEDNPHLMENDPTYIARLQLLPDSEREAKMSGNWFTFSGQVFSEFRIKPLMNEPENAQHVIEPFPIPSYWPKILAIDWGYAANTFAGWAAISPNGRIYIYRTFKKRKITVREWGAEIGLLSSTDRNLVKVVLDPSAWQKKGHEFTIEQEFSLASNLFPEKADNDRHSGISLIHEFLRFKPRPSTKLLQKDYDPDLATRILRLNGLDEYNKYLDLFTPEEKESNLPILQIFNTESDLIECIQTCQYDEKDKEDVAEFSGDDPFDMLRYLVKASKVHLDDAIREMKDLQRLENIEKNLSQTGDQHSYYMAMSRFESNKRNSAPRTVRRGMR